MVQLQVRFYIGAYSTAKCKPITVFYPWWGPAGVCPTSLLFWTCALLSHCTPQILEDRGDWKRRWKILLSQKGNNVSYLLISSCDRRKTIVDCKSNQEEWEHLGSGGIRPCQEKRTRECKSVSISAFFLFCIVLLWKLIMSIPITEEERRKPFPMIGMK